MIQERNLAHAMLVLSPLPSSPSLIFASSVHRMSFSRNDIGCTEDQQKNKCHFCGANQLPTKIGQLLPTKFLNLFDESKNKAALCNRQMTPFSAAGESIHPSPSIAFPRKERLPVCYVSRKRSPYSITSASSYFCLPLCFVAMKVRDVGDFQNQAGRARS